MASKKKSNEKRDTFEAKFDEILVCNDKQFGPYLEIFIAKPENISQQSLGTIFGIFEIQEYSPDSSYIVNYLISIIKKDYFLRTKKNPIDNLEAALHKANLALSKLASQGNVNWIGKINAICGIIEKNNFHFSQTGNVAAFMLRANSFSEITEKEIPDDSLNPLKTFVNLSSGKIENGDKIIFSTTDIFEIFSFEELKKSAIRFSSDEFIQFLRTALGNELSKAAVLVVNVKKMQTEIITAHPKKHDVNAFSQDAFKRQSDDAKRSSRKEILKTIEDEKIVSNKQEGHIYIKGDSAADNVAGESKFYEVSLMILRTLSEKSAKLYRLGRKKIKKWQSKRSSGDIARESAKMPGSHLPTAPTALAAQKSVSTNEQKQVFAGDVWLRRISSKPQRLLELIKDLTYQQKIYSLILLLLIFIVPYLFIKIKNSREVQLDSPNLNETAQSLPEPAVSQPLEGEKNLIRISETREIFYGQDIRKIVSLPEKTYAIMKNELVEISENKSFPYDGSKFDPVNGVFMKDLNLIFLLGNKNDVLSFSPVLNSFQKNSLDYPGAKPPTSAGTYLSYLYLVDTENRQIYRYPRAEDGFGKRIDWLKESLDLNNTTGIAVGENIFLAVNSKIKKLFMGKAQNFQMESTPNPIEADKIFLAEKTKNLFILDKTNSRIVKSDLDGNIIAQYYNPELSGAKDFSYNEDQKTVLFLKENSVKMLILP